LKRALEFEFMEIDCINFCVVNATQTLELLVDRMGLQNIGRRDREHTIEYLVGNDSLLFSIASPLNPDSPVADYLKLHPSGIKDVDYPDWELRLSIDRVKTTSENG
jgi:4-hydroxyphenylpyruvate dioxygenase